MWGVEEVEEGIVLYCFCHSASCSPPLVFLLLLYRFDCYIFTFLPIYLTTEKNILQRKYTKIILKITLLKNFNAWKSVAPPPFQSIKTMNYHTLCTWQFLGLQMRKDPLHQVLTSLSSALLKQCLWRNHWCQSKILEWIPGKETESTFQIPCLSFGINFMYKCLLIAWSLILQSNSSMLIFKTITVFLYVIKMILGQTWNTKI